jgi:Sec-independent protein translocase protein TatA
VGKPTKSIEQKEYSFFGGNRQIYDILPLGMFANIGPAEAIIILIALLSAIFGRKKTTEIAQDVGRASVEFKKAQKEYRDAVEDLKKPVNEFISAPPPPEPPPVDAAKEEVAQLAQMAKDVKEQKSKGGES